ncbi:MAG: hypothetical protein PHG35_03305 [Dehalococcoidales bacterium]|nr:hypothetical protein [Dehalococcoidales bacterium]
MTMNGETKTAENALAQQRPSPEDGTTPSAPEEKMVPEKEIVKRHSKLMKTIDTLTKERDASNQNLDSLTKEINELRRRQDEKEEAEASATPDGRKEWQRKRDLDKREQELKGRIAKQEAKEAEFAEHLKQADESSREVMIQRVAKENALDPATLKSDCEELGFTSEEQVTRYAQKFVKPDPNKPATPPLHLDPNKPGGKKSFSDMTTDEKIEYGMNHPNEKMN